VTDIHQPEAKSERSKLPAIPLRQAGAEADEGAHAQDQMWDAPDITQPAESKHIYFDDDPDQADPRNKRRYKIASRDCHHYNQVDIYASYRSWEGHTGVPKKSIPPCFRMKGPQRNLPDPTVVPPNRPSL